MSKKSGDGKSGNGDDYESGYKKPPMHTRWKKGQSGNQRGRRRKRVNLSDFETAFDKALSAYITVSENGTVHQIKKLNALATQTVNKALKGNHQATNLVLSMFARRAATAPEEDASGLTSDEFKAELEAIFQEMTAKSPAKPKESSPEGSKEVACTRFRRHRVRCFNGTGGGSWKGENLHASSSLRLCG
jgi:hypothetical protein